MQAIFNSLSLHQTLSHAMQLTTIEYFVYIFIEASLRTCDFVFVCVCPVPVHQRVCLYSNVFYCVFVVV